MEKSINKMGTMPVNKLMLTLGAPMIISMVSVSYTHLTLPTNSLV